MSKACPLKNIREVLLRRGRSRPHESGAHLTLMPQSPEVGANCFYNEFLK